MSVQIGHHSTEQATEQIIELVGEVRAVTLNDDDDGGECQFRLDDGTTVAVDFSEEHEARIAVALWQHKAQRIRITGLGDFGVDGQLRRVCRLDTQMPERPPQPSPLPPAAPGSAREFMENLVAFSKTIPDEELAKFPTDFSENLDHYLYGAPSEARNDAGFRRYFLLVRADD